MTSAEILSAIGLRLTQKSVDLNPFLWKVSSLNSLRGKCCCISNLSSFAGLHGLDVVFKFDLSAACPHYPCSWSNCGRQAAYMSLGGHAVCSWVCLGLLFFLCFWLCLLDSDACALVWVSDFSKLCQSLGDAPGQIQECFTIGVTQKT